MRHFQDSKINDQDLILLFQLIQKNGNIDNMVNLGYQPSQIANILNFLIENTYIEYNEKGILLSKRGLELLSMLNEKSKRKNIETLISPQAEYKLNSQLSVFEIYLPKDEKELD